MNLEKPKLPRGRPKTMNRAHTLDIAMNSYWADGVGNVSLNEVCRRAKVSKPALYREFGNEDGLMKASLEQYQQQVLSKIYSTLSADIPFFDVLDILKTYATFGSKEPFVHTGCLFVLMKDKQSKLGDATKAELLQAHALILKAYESWIDKAKTNNEISTKVESRLLATYITTQLGSAFSQQKRGDNPEDIHQVLTMALLIIK